MVHLVFPFRLLVGKEIIVMDKEIKLLSSFREKKYNHYKIVIFNNKH